MGVERCYASANSYATFMPSLSYLPTRNRATPMCLHAKHLDPTHNIMTVMTYSPRLTHYNPHFV